MGFPRRLRRSRNPGGAIPNMVAMPHGSASLSRASPVARRADFDWLRLIAIVVLVFFHSALPFTSFGWYIKDAARSPVFDGAVMYLHEFRLQLLYLVSGAALALAGGNLPPARLALDRVKRLLIPLVFGMLVVIPPHAYFEYRSRGAGAHGFVEFLPVYFTSGIEPAGYIGFKHLWFLAHLLAVSLVMAPVLAWLRRRSADGSLSRWSGRVRPWHLLVLLPAPLVVNEVALRGVSWDGSVIRDPAGLIQCGLFLLLGAWAALSPALSDSMARARWAALALGVPAFVLAAGSYMHFRDQGLARPEAHWAVGALRAVNTSLWVVFWAGTARRYLSVAPAWLRGANRFVYPGYILHQTLIVMVAFYIVGWSAPIAVKYAAIVAIAGLATVAAVLIVDRVPVLRQCMGIWQARRKPAPPLPVAASAGISADGATACRPAQSR